MTAVLIVDDRPLQRFGFRMLLESTPGIEVVGEAAHGAKAVRQAADLCPEVALMDVRMPGMDGIEATRRIVAGEDRSRVLVLTTFDLDEDAHAALRAGASGLLLKDALPDELLAGIRAVACGKAVIAPVSPVASWTPTPIDCQGLPTAGHCRRRPRGALTHRAGARDLGRDRPGLDQRRDRRAAGVVGVHGEEPSWRRSAPGSRAATRKASTRHGRSIQASRPASPSSAVFGHGSRRRVGGGRRQRDAERRPVHLHPFRDHRRS